MKLNDDDFGFSLVSEEELKAYEEQLKKTVEEQSKVVQETAQSAMSVQEKLKGLKSMIMPLLVNLAKDPDKTYIYWPNRVEKIEAFIQKIDAYIDE